MAKIVQEIYPGVGGLDWDSDKRFMDANDSDYRLNIIPNAYGNDYVLTNIKGNTRYSHSFSHSSSYSGATYTCIGDCYDDNRDSLYFFIYSDQSNHSILRFNFSDNSFDKIVWDHTGIDLDIDYPITDAFMIGDWLHFNPRSTSPRSINVQWAYYDHISYYIGDGVNRTVGQYVEYLNKVYIVTEAVDGDLVPETQPDKYSFVDFCYQDVYPINAAGIDPTGYIVAGQYKRVRDFYNIPTLLTSTVTTVVATDTNFIYNNIRGRRFQFCYRHYVPDQGFTITSPFTGIIAPPSSETNKGEVVGEIQDYNKVTITFPLATEAQEVSAPGTTTTTTTTLSAATVWYNHDTLFEFVEILFREGSEDDWKVAERIDHTTIAINYSDTYYEIDFFNDRAYEVVDNVEVEKQYNPLPKKALAQWSLDGERSVYGGITEGFDNFVDVNTTLTTGYTAIEISDTTTGAAEHTYGWTVTWDYVLSSWQWELTDVLVLDDVDEGDIINVTISGVEYSRTLSATDVLSVGNYSDAFIYLLIQGGVEAVASPGPKLQFHSSIPAGYVSSIQLFGTSGTTSTLALKYSSFKNGSWHPFCLYYYDDAMRRSDPVFDSSMRVYMETLPEIVPGGSTNYFRYIDWTIAHLPPQWAKYWRWGYAGNQTIDKFWQYNISELSSQTKDLTDTWTRLDISPLQKIDDPNSGFDHYFPNTTIDAYSYEPGDRVRFITTGQDKPATYDELWVASENKDYEILEYDDVNNYIYIDDLSAPLTTSTTTIAGIDDETYIIEIYRPKKQVGDTVYYEYGPLYDVYQSSGVYYHRGATQDQTSVQSATGQFTKGDVWVITRLFSVSPFLASPDNAAFIESESWSDFHDTSGWGKGKAGFFTGIGEKYLNNARHGNRYSPNTKTSGLSTFDFLDYKELSTDHGNIIAMRQAGNTLKVYFERNSAAVLVNKAQFYNADGTSQVVKSDNVLGDAVYSNYHYGTIFPESVILKDRTVFFYDIYREAYIKDSPNGVTPISHNNKMRRYFHEKSEALRSSGVSNIQVFSAYDYEYNMVYVHFIDATDDTNNDVILFHEPQDKWVTFHQTNGTIVSVPTTTSTSSTTSTTSTTSTEEAYNSGLIFGHGSLRLMSYIGEDVYIHNSNSIRNNFWGTQYDSIVDFTANQHPNVKKRFETICLHTNKPWDCNYVAVDADGTYEDGMQSKIPESRFKLREGIYCSHYLRNMKTYSSSASILDLIRGEQLRGYFAEHRIINDDTTEVKLFKIDVRSHISRI